MNNKDLMYTTGNYIQKFVITYKGKESEKNIYEYMYTHTHTYVYVTESLYTPEITIVN